MIVDLRNVRCGQCKVALKDEQAMTCPACGAKFGAVSSNHVGLADKLRRKRQAADAVRGGAG